MQKYQNWLKIKRYDAKICSEVLVTVDFIIFSRYDMHITLSPKDYGNEENNDAAGTKWQIVHETRTFLNRS